MPPECMELWARRFKIKGGRTGSWALLHRGRLDDRAAAACISQRTVFWMDFGWEKKPQMQQDWAGLAEGGRAILWVF